MSGSLKDAQLMVAPLQDELLIHTLITASCGGRDTLLS